MVPVLLVVVAIELAVVICDDDDDDEIPVVDVVVVTFAVVLPLPVHALALHNTELCPLDPCTSVLLRLVLNLSAPLALVEHPATTSALVTSLGVVSERPKNAAAAAHSDSEVMVQYCAPSQAPPNTANARLFPFPIPLELVVVTLVEMVVVAVAGAVVEDTMLVLVLVLVFVVEVEVELNLA